MNLSCSAYKEAHSMIRRIMARSMSQYWLWAAIASESTMWRPCGLPSDGSVEPGCALVRFPHIPGITVLAFAPLASGRDNRIIQYLQCLDLEISAQPTKVAKAQGSRSAAERRLPAPSLSLPRPSCLPLHPMRPLLPKTFALGP